MQLVAHSLALLTAPPCLVLQAKKRLAAKKKAAASKGKTGSAALQAKAAAEAKARAAKKGKGKDKSSYNQVRSCAGSCGSGRAHAAEPRAHGHVTGGGGLAGDWLWGPWRDVVVSHVMQGVCRVHSAASLI